MAAPAPRDPVARLADLDAATVHEAAGRTGDLDPGIRPIQSGATVAGRAVTAHCHPGDNLAIHRALLAAGPGDVLVVAAGGHLAGYWGEILAVAAQHKGVAGLVVDGGCRDTAALRRMGFPVWSAGVCVHGTVKRTAQSVNEPVVAGGVLVSPGDYVLADDDGVVVVPAARVGAVLDAAEARRDKEAAAFARLRAGATTFDVLGIEDVGAGG
ncbi:4-carboxy-4-hydroxy-2-oxoadipate aldolase/oxaloacetate decarboxylase [Phytohabitans sp. ZYX-F-186]|uniref:Putative 4-hydroxy-4-methyl-2-oxoglutarate aldolase n=1 Tax=Phytohabitans maris TaxID=3071409 RepID=A0ABU0ZMA1_9ACTN|nr:4-carboxy-4-hydroxy-2-oxoadipate aldolase/oxaloacetate decarboxylase [Phytohabitans sp. ZYX-F-186]MDQ7908171.1 4-carboxy-4-hydroxy-2-oxoadipate aldolase/oxaloacetate decarboxylase [Phytohabitans sp. ZYX-F-186]